MKNNDIKIRRGPSSLHEFIERPLPSDQAVEAFEHYVANEAKEEEIKDSLTKIYQDKNGELLDVRQLTFKPRRGFIFKLFTFLVLAFALAGALYAAYNYIYLNIGSNKQPVSLVFAAKKEVAAGEEFYYDLNYKNEDRVAINNIEIKVKYPDNFIFLDSEPKPSRGDDTWEIPALGARRSDAIKIKGKLAGQLLSGHIIIADMTYRPENFSSDFKRSADFSVKINDLGLDIDFLSGSSALLKEENEIEFKFKAKDLNYLDNFRLTAAHGDETEIISGSLGSATGTPAVPLVKSSGPAAWDISNLGKNENIFKIKFKVKEKKQPQAVLKIKIELPDASAEPVKYYLFYEKDLIYDIIKSDLNINLIINGSALDQGVDFGQTLNYSISYKNVGDDEMKDIIIMSVIESDFLDWQTLADKLNGRISGNTISWSKAEIPALASLASGTEGAIDFSISLKPVGAVDLSKNYQIKNYVSYSIAGKSAAGKSQSNVIINKINSDLSLNEQLRYFSDDNIAVGYGPLPPKVNQTTSLKVYWSISNNLHELSNLQVSLDLPPGINWDYKNRSSLGRLDYDSYSRRVLWQIDRLPVAAGFVTAEFNLTVAPQDRDRNKIMVIVPGTVLSAQDAVTGAKISKVLKAKTTKLEDDNLANTDGIVE